KVRVAALDGNSYGFHVVKIREALNDLRTNLYVRKILLGVAHLLVDPGARFRTLLIFEPTIIVGEGVAGDFVGNRLHLRRRRWRKDDAVSASNFFLGGNISRDQGHGCSQSARNEDQDF